MQQDQLHVIIIHVYSAALILQGTLPPVYGASEGGHLAIVELLVSRGARINQPTVVRLIIINFVYMLIIGASRSDPHINHEISLELCMHVDIIMSTCTCSLAHNA